MSSVRKVSVQSIYCESKVHSRTIYHDRCISFTFFTKLIFRERIQAEKGDCPGAVLSNIDRKNHARHEQISMPCEGEKKLKGGKEKR